MLFCARAGTVGARLHVPFPVLNRTSFGFWFSYFSVISRVVLAMFWFGIQVCVRVIQVVHPLELGPCRFRHLLGRNVFIK
jgi:cytosine/uracil/thiamine/allantoin permease